MIRLLGLPQTLAMFAKTAVKGELAAEAAERVLGEGVATAARAQVPVLTGETQASIDVTDEGVEAAGASLYLEFGTVNMAAQPFLRPAADGAKALEPAIAAAARVILGGL